MDPVKAKYLHDLQITNEDGTIRKEMAGKYKQVQKIITILDDTIKSEKVPFGKRIRVVDMGSGKGYLTFALHDYFNNYLEIDAEVVGVETNKELVELCNFFASKAGANSNLKFVNGYIGDFSDKEIDVLIALHACDTATDDAIYKGIKAKSRIIMVVPCCQKEIRPQFTAPVEESSIFKFDTFKDRFSQMLTDSIRSLIMESEGYRTKAFEFISDAHTHRNVMLLGIYSGQKDPGKITEVGALKKRYGIEHQRLEQLLG